MVSNRIKKLDVIIVSVNYNDFLLISLENNSKIFENITVVTSTSDFMCQKICENFEVKCLVTDIMYEDGDFFNKGKAINEGLKSISDPDYILLLDADILIMDHIDIDCLEEDILYTSDRCIVPDYDYYQKYISGDITKDNLFIEGDQGLGFFQLFNFYMRNEYPQYSTDASNDDLRFRDSFDLRRCVKNSVLHLGKDSNWRSRKSKSFLDYTQFSNLLEKNLVREKKTFKICTFYYNPQKDVRREENFLRFLDQFEGYQDNMLIGLVDYDGDLEIPDYLKDNILIIKGDRENTIWYKETLMNKMIDIVDTDYIIWIDNDLIYENLDWLKNINSVVKDKDFVQLYKTINYLDENGSVVESYSSIISLVYDIDILYRKEYIKRYENTKDFKPGGSWIGKTSILKENRFFEKMYVGGGDTIFLYGLFGIDDGHTLNLVKESNEYIWKEAVEWINSQKKYRLGYLDVSINHLYHGDLKERNYNGRYLRLSNFKRKCSIIIPAYKASEFILDCVESIINQSENIDIEILIGIDDCSETLSFIQSCEIIKNKCKLYYFTENCGPYLIRNTLSEISKYNNLIFFDADDIMNDNLISETLKILSKNDVVRWGFYDFINDVEEGSLSSMHANGAFAMKKDVFLKLNGFLPLRISADSEFRHRLKYNGYITENSNIKFFRRIHENNLTRNKTTGMKSPERIRVDGEIKRMVDLNIFENPEYLQTSSYRELDFKIDLNEYFEKIYCLNLDRRVDRFDSIKSKFDKLKIKFDKFSAIDGNNIDVSNFDLKSYKSSNKESNFKYEIACILSHIEIIKDAKKNGYNRILIFEDDCLISSNIHERIQKIREISEWKLLYLGSSQYNWNVEKIGDSLFYSKDSLGTFAYAVDSSIYDEIIEHFSNFKTTVDNMLTEIQSKYYKKCYTFFPNIVIADVSDSDIRGMRNNEKHSVRMRWNLLNDYV